MTVEDYYKIYKEGLTSIIHEVQTPTEVKDRAHSILSKTNLEVFRAKYNMWRVEVEKDKAKDSIAKGYASLAKGAGALLQVEDVDSFENAMTEISSTYRCCTPPPHVPGLTEDLNLEDNIADFCHDGELQDFMDEAGFSMALDALPTMPDLPQGQQDMLDSLFEGKVTLKVLSGRIDDLMKVSNPVPDVNRYIFTAFQPYRAAFMNTGIISQDINERQYFRDYVVELLRGALSIQGIPYMWGEVYVPAVSYRKSNDADATGRGKFADGASEVDGHQVFLSESSKLHRVTASKDQEDKAKLKRMLRDLFNFTILEMIRNKDGVKPNLTVFGSRTFKDTTELIAMDYHGMYRTYCLGSFRIMAAANDVKNLKECFEMCLRFSMAVKEQITERSEMGKLQDVEVIKLTKAARKLLTHTSCTPPNPPTQTSRSPSKQRAQQRAQQRARHNAQQ
ncbi:hypothetical protein BG011_008183 [Mortierella polycephala]|uniref:Uncharacterized protein n=1 Tax=Mortierella polycephala TaxID=41804 RepID=A0A9P6PQG2_9FUNG|nr:hypothetical protein BG011_008183 [Mortierella polycephala]